MYFLVWISTLKLTLLRPPVARLIGRPSTDRTPPHAMSTRPRSVR